MHIRLDPKGPATLITISGELDSRSAAELDECLAKLFEKGRYKLVVDLNKVEYMDSSGYSRLVGGLKVCYRNGGYLVVVSRNKTINEVLIGTRMDSIFKLSKSVEEAIALFTD
jgi:anti-sigma B factor antagonist